MLIPQSGVIPFRGAGDDLEVLLITSRRAKHWIVPKGLIEDGLSPEASAAREAWEEAGVRGTLYRPSLGTWTYGKWGGTCRVEVFPMAVTEVADVWPESHRRRRWLPVPDALRRVDAADLAALLMDLPRCVAARS